MNVKLFAASVLAVVAACGIALAAAAGSVALQSSSSPDATSNFVQSGGLVADANDSRTFAEVSMHASASAPR